MIDLGHHTLPDGRSAEVVEIAGGGLRARIATLGAAVLELWVPDAHGVAADVALGHARLGDYVGDPAFLGLAVGPVAGRIGGAQVMVDGTTYALDANDGAHTLHSGPSGLHSRVWRLVEAAPDCVTLSATHPDGAGGFPGPIHARLAFSVAEGALALDWTVTADQAAPVAPTHHLYLHLDGHDAGSVSGLTVRSDADCFARLGPDLVPTGALALVAGTPFDFSSPVALADVLDADHPQIDRANGLDHDLVGPGRERTRPLRRVAEVEGASRRLEVWTTEPGVHLYAGGFLDVARGKGGARYRPYSGLALETQPPPDATAHAAFPDTTLRPGQTLRSRTEYRFATL